MPTQLKARPTSPETRDSRSRTTTGRSKTQRKFRCPNQPWQRRPTRARRGNGAGRSPRADLENSSPEDGEDDGAGGKPGDRQRQQQQKKTNGRTLEGSSATGKKSRSKPPPAEGDKGTNGKDGGRDRVAVKHGRPPAAAARSHGGNGRRRDSLPAAGNANGTVASLLSSRLRHGDGSPALSIHGGGARRRR
ncbi:hypothetical protein THAOC_19943, partial [Thalassiosira oceanica]